MANLREAVDAVHRKVIYPHLTAGAAQKDREIAHERAVDLMERYIERSSLLLKVIDRFFRYDDPVLEAEVGGFKYRNPLGLAAGMDKNGRTIRTWLATGLGFGEIGSATYLKFGGNDRTVQERINAHEDDDAYSNWLGFPGEGTDSVVKRTKPKAAEIENSKTHIWMNVSASKKSFEAGTQIADFEQAFEDVQAVPHPKTIDNLSSPNTEGVIDLQDPEEIKKLLDKNADYQARKGIWISTGLKFSNDRTPDQMYQSLNVVRDFPFVDTIILGNTSTDPEIRARLKSSNRDRIGGISGPPIRQKSLALQDAVYEMFGDQFRYVQVGGLQTGYDLVESIAHGATWAEALTVFVNRRTSTPNRAHYILREAARIVKHELRLENIQQVRGNRSVMNWLPKPT